MLGKLVKYEMAALGRVFLPVYGALIIMSAINRILSEIHIQTLFFGISMGLVSMLMGGICVLTLVLTLQRFRKNLLGNEGYLMFTLPVSVDKLIVSKLIGAFLWALASMIVLVVSVYIMAGTFTFDIGEFIRNLRTFIQSLDAGTFEVVGFILEGLLFVILGALSSILLFYTCMSLSLLVNKRRGLFTFGAFIVITLVWELIGAAAANIIHFESIEIVSNAAVHGCIWLGIACELITFCAFYFTTRYMLTRKLNIE